jgi:glutathione S-transferase
VTLTALEQVGVPYAAHMVDFARGENRSEGYLALNPQGKVPCLLVDGRALTENVAILRWLHATYPDAGLFPPAATAWDQAEQLRPLLWIASTWHPAVRSIKVPFMVTKGDPAPVKARGEEVYRGLLDSLDAQLATRRWWHGDAWSITDTYFWWAYVNAEFGGFDLSPWRNVARHRADVEALPQVQRALAREAGELQAMEARGG